jgi:hypothetical protein
MTSAKVVSRLFIFMFFQLLAVLRMPIAHLILEMAQADLTAPLVKSIEYAQSGLRCLSNPFRRFIETTAR